MVPWNGGTKPRASIYPIANVIACQRRCPIVSDLQRGGTAPGRGPDARPGSQPARSRQTRRGATGRGPATLGYPQSPLAMERPQRNAGVLAGDRAPDAPIRGAAGQPWRGKMAALGAYMSRVGLTLPAPCGRAEKWNPRTTLPALPSISRSCHCPAGLSPIVKRRVCGSGSAALAAKGAAPRPEHPVFPVCSAARQTCGALRC